MATTEPTVSIRPSDFGKGGGLIDDVDVTIKEARWAPWDYNGKAAMVTAARVLYIDAEDVEHPAYYSIGNDGTKSFVPSKDGKKLSKIGDKEQLAESCNFFQFISSVVNAGYPEDQIDGSDISFLDGMSVHVKREAQPTRTGIKREEGAREQTVLCISKIYEKGAKGGKTAAKPAAKTAAGKTNGSAAAVDSDLDAKAADAVLSVLGEAGGSLTKAKLSSALFAHLKGDPDSTKVISLAFKNDFLAAEGRPWTFSGTEVSLG